MASKLVGDVTETVRFIQEEAKEHRRQIESFERFFDLLTRLVDRHAHEFVPTMQTLGRHFADGLAHEKTLVDAEERLADDINDVAARYEVFCRVTDESVETRKKVKESRARISNLRTALAADEAKGGAKRIKIEADIRAAVEAKRAAVEAAEAKLEELISVRQSYNRFKVRRLKHGYQNLGRVMITAVQGIADAFAELRREIDDVRGRIDAVLDSGDLLEGALGDAGQQNHDEDPAAADAHPVEPVPGE
jgi:hypothetical protein